MDQSTNIKNSNTITTSSKIPIASLNNNNNITSNTNEGALLNDSYDNESDAGSSSSSTTSSSSDLSDFDDEIDESKDQTKNNQISLINCNISKSNEVLVAELTTTINDNKTQNHQLEEDNINNNNKELDQEEGQETNNSAIRLRTNRKQRSTSNSNDTNKLDSVRFSMYNIQNSQLNEIDALLSELNQLQNTLDVTESPTNALVPVDVSSKNMNQFKTQHNFNSHHQNDEIEAIDQQFDEVLKFLAQSIDETASSSANSASNGNCSPQLSSSSPSSMSLSVNTPNSDIVVSTEIQASIVTCSNQIKKMSDRQSANDGSNSSNSSGIGDDSYINDSATPPGAYSSAQKYHQQQQQKQFNNNQTKRNSSDSAFVDTSSMPTSFSRITKRKINTSDVNNNNSNNRNYVNRASSLSNSDTNSCEKTSPSSSSPSISHNSNSNIKAATQYPPQASTQAQTEAQKAELIRIALEKLKEANIRKLIVKAYTDDGCTKSVIIDETMKVYDVMLMLFTKNHSKPSINYSIVEYLPKFHMERIFEDHENLVEAMSNWSRDSENQIIFTEKSDKYDLFLKPEMYLLNENINAKKLIDESERNKLIIDYFQNIGSPVPQIEGPLYLKTESKKSWKKYYCVLRQSGLYYIPKGKNKKDLQCLFSFDKLDLYYGIDWKKEFKAPTDSCFALKYPQVQKKSSKYIKYLCCENNRDMKRWFNGIRIAKFGKQLFDNYKKILELIEISKISGKVPLVMNRRLSASISNQNNYNNQRPRSSYSLLSNSNSTDNNAPNEGNKINNSNNENNPDSVEMVNIQSYMHKSYANLDPNSNQSQNSSNCLSNSLYTLSNSLSSSSSLLIRKDINNSVSQSSINNSVKAPQNTSNYHSNIKSPSLAYTEQLKSLIQSHNNLHAESEANRFNNTEERCDLMDNSAKPWQNILTPISVSTNTNAPQSLSHPKHSSVSPNHKIVKIPVNIDHAKHLVNIPTIHTQVNNVPANINNDGLVRKEKPAPPQRIFELETPVLAKPSNLNLPNNNLNYLNSNNFSNENVYDLPSPPIELLQPEEQFEHNLLSQQGYSLVNTNTTNMISSSNNINRSSKGPAPPVAPKPQIKRLNSSNGNDSLQNETTTNDFHRLRKSFDSNPHEINGFSSVRLSNTSSTRSSLNTYNQNQNQNPHLINELSTILARQKKKIEDTTQPTNEPCSNSSHMTKTNSISPSLARKPPPPPRSDRTQLSRRFSNDNGK